MTNANAKTISKFGPSGSLMSANTARELTTETIPRIINKDLLVFIFIV